MNKTHYDEWASENPGIVQLVNETIEKVNQSQELMIKPDITYIDFKKLNRGVVTSTSYYDDSYWQEIYMIFCFIRNGCRIYDLAPSLCDRFLATHIKKVPTDLLQMPFKSIVLKIPKGVLKHVVNDTPTYISDIYCHYGVADGWYEGKGSLIKLSSILRSYHTEECHATLTWSIFLCKPSIEECVKDSVKTITDYPQFLMNKENEYRVKHPETEKEFGNKTIAELAGYKPPTEADLKFISDTFEFAMKSFLYIIGANSDIIYADNSIPLVQKLRRVKSAGKRKELQRRIDNIGSPRYLVGSKIILTRGEQVMYSGIKTGQWSVSYRFCVAGHYREQPCGEGRLLRKTIFIQPFWKGPEFAEVVTKEHYVK